VRPQRPNPVVVATRPVPACCTARTFGAPHPRVVAHFAKTRPCRTRREEPAPAEAGVVARFRKNQAHRELCPSFRWQGRCAISQKPSPPRPVPVLPLGGSLRDFAKTTDAATCAHPYPGRALARAEPDERSLPRRGPGLLRNFAKKHPRRLQPAPTRHSQPPSRPLAPVGLHHGRRGNPPVPALRAKRHSALPCSDSEQPESEPQIPQTADAVAPPGRHQPAARSDDRRSSAFIGGKNPCLPRQTTAPPPMARRPARAQPRRTQPQPRRRSAPHSSPAAAAARDAGVSISSGATGPVYVYPKNSRRSGLVMFSHPGYFRAARSSGTQVNA
jgi:hypothetical protein